MYWKFMLIAVLLIPLAMIVTGFLFMKKPPQKINNTFGYRTKRSMKNNDTWRFAHICCGKYLSIFGGVLLPVSALIMLFIPREEQCVTIAAIVIVLVQCVFLGVSFSLTERALKKKFN